MRFGLPLGLCFLTTVALAANITYEDDRIRVALPVGWTAGPATVAVASDPRFQMKGPPLRIGGVLRKGKYEIYLLTHHSQASGIIGGRFGEISEWVTPWMKVNDPWGCVGYFRSSQTLVTKDLARVDLYYDPKSARRGDPECEALVSKLRGKVWLGSFFSPRGGGYFLTYPLAKTQIDGADEEMTFSATIATDDPTTLPLVNDPQLKAFLEEASAIVRSVHYKVGLPNDK